MIAPTPDPAASRRGWLPGRAASLSVLAVVVAGAAAVMPRLEVETDITRFLPPSGDVDVDRVLRTVTGSELNRMVVLAVTSDGLTAPDEVPLAHAAADSIAERLAHHPEVAWLRSGPDPELERSVYELYQPHRFGFVRPDPPATGPLLTDDELRRRATALRRRLSLPTAPFLRELAQRDPWLLFVDRLDVLRDQLAGDLEVSHGHFVPPRDDQTVVLFLATQSSPFRGSAARRFLRALDAAVAHARATVDPGVRVAQSGVHRFAVRGEDRTREDIQRVSAAGAFAVIAFLFILFRSPWLLLVAQAPLVLGVATGFLFAAGVLGRVHGLTVAFAATLIGVTLDYVVHALNHHVLRREPGGVPFAAVRPGIVLGGLTTLAGLGGLAWTGFPAIQDMALLTVAGVTGALVGTLVLLPALLPRSPVHPSGAHRRLERWSGRVLTALARHRRAAVGVAAVLSLGLVSGLTRAHFVDDVRALEPPDSDLLAEDEGVRRLVGRVDTGRLVVVSGVEEEALAANDAVASALRSAVGEGEIRRFASLHALVWSEDLQRRNLAALSSPDAVWAQTRDAFAASGFRPEAFAGFRADLDEPPPPLTLGEVLASPLGALAAPFVLARDPTGEGLVLATYLEGVSNPEAVAARMADIEGAVWLDQGQAVAEGYRRFRARTLELVGAGLVVVFLLVLARYRRLRVALAAFVPAVLAAAAALGALSWVGAPLTIFHVVSLILVLSMGVDYGVFLVESGPKPADGAATLVSLLIAAASTVLSFGALAFSGQPALEAIGWTTALGVAASLVFAPLGFLFTRTDDPS